MCKNKHTEQREISIVQLNDGHIFMLPDMHMPYIYSIYCVETYSRNIFNDIAIIKSLIKTHNRRGPTAAASAVAAASRTHDTRHRTHHAQCVSILTFFQMPRLSLRLESLSSGACWSQPMVFFIQFNIPSKKYLSNTIWA